MTYATTPERGKVLQSHLLQQVMGIEHFSSLKESTHAERDVYLPRQVHGTHIIIKEEDTSVDTEADAVICQTNGQWIGVRTADCVPVLMAAPQSGMVAAIHAGWRGTVKHIVRLTIERMKELGCKPEEMYAMVGPSISADVYEVGPEVVEAFSKAGRAECVVHRQAAQGEKTFVDLWQSNVMDMLDCDIPLQNIDCTPLCTYTDNDVLYSARREGIGTGRNITAIRLMTT